MLVLAIALYVLSALLPLLGLARVARRARSNFVEKRDAPPVQGPNIAMDFGGQTMMMRGPDMFAASEAAASAPVLGWQQVKWDLGLIGGGIVCATVASILSLFL